MQGFWHSVLQGDCLNSIASDYGFSWRTLWNHPSNAPLKSLRKNPNVLFPDDQVFIPEKKPKVCTKPTDQKHRFVRKGIPTKVRLRLLMYGQPRSNMKYIFVVEGSVRTGTTDGDGVLEQYVPPGAQRAELTIYNGEVSEKHMILLGHLDPITEVRGVQQRLANLGCPCEVTGDLDDQTKTALGTFLLKYGLPSDTEVDADLYQKLQDYHGA